MRPLPPYPPIDDLPGIPDSAPLIMTAVKPELWTAVWEEMEQESLGDGVPTEEMVALALARARRRVQQREMEQRVIRQRVNGRRVRRWVMPQSLEQMRLPPWTNPQAIEAAALDRLFCRWLVQRLRGQRPLLAQVVLLRLRGYTQAEIAELVEISQSQVS